MHGNYSTNEKGLELVRITMNADYVSNNSDEHLRRSEERDFAGLLAPDLYRSERQNG